MPDERRIWKAYLFPNGMVATFDKHGEQMPEYQGTKEEVWEKVKRDAPAGALLNGVVHLPPDAA